MFSRKRPRHVRPATRRRPTALAQSLIGRRRGAGARARPVRRPARARRGAAARPGQPADPGGRRRRGAGAGQPGRRHRARGAGRPASGAVEFGVFAAPRTEGIWDEVRDEMVRDMAADEDRRRTRSTAPYGTELLARLPRPGGQPGGRAVRRRRRAALVRQGAPSRARSRGRSRAQAPVLGASAWRARGGPRRRAPPGPRAAAAAAAAGDGRPGRGGTRTEQRLTVSQRSTLTTALPAYRGWAAPAHTVPSTGGARGGSDPRPCRPTNAPPACAGSSSG